MKKNILIILLLLIFTGSSFAGAWTQKKNSGFYKVDYRILSAKKVFGPTGDKFDIQQLTEQTIGIYGEYGINDMLTGVLSFHPLKMIKSDTLVNGETKNNGIGDLSLGLRVRLAQFGNSVLSGDVHFGIPTGDNEPANGLITGDGEFNQQFGIQFGHSFYPAPSYINLAVGFNNRNEGYSDEFYSSIEVGYNITEQFLLVGRVKLLRSMKNGDNSFSGGYAGLNSNNQEYVAYGPELIYFIDNNWGISALFESGTAAKNIQSAPVFAFGVFFKH